MLETNSDIIRGRLVDAGVSPTVQRIAIAKALYVADHPTASELYASVRKRLPRVSQATVYNNLHAFVKAGLVREVRAGSDAPVRYDGNPEPHHHLLDLASSRLVDIPLEEVEISNLTELEQKYDVSRITVVLEGAAPPVSEVASDSTNNGD